MYDDNITLAVECICSERGVGFARLRGGCLGSLHDCKTRDVQLHGTNQTGKIRPRRHRISCWGQGLASSKLEGAGEIHVACSLYGCHL